MLSLLYTSILGILLTQTITPLSPSGCPTVLDSYWSGRPWRRVDCFTQQYHLDDLKGKFKQSLEHILEQPTLSVGTCIKLTGWVTASVRMSSSSQQFDSNV